MGRHTSSTLILNTRAPQGCFETPAVLPYTHNCVATFYSNTIIKFADDTAVVGLITDNNEKDNNLLMMMEAGKELRPP